MKKALFSSFKISLCIIGYLCCSSNIASAQISSDGTTETTVEQNNNSIEINGGSRAGANLFHSFRDFAVPTGNEALFNNASDVANILSRVTGGNISNIDGLIRANGSANLFLINPAGIIFGENARLDIGGSFLGTTADSVLFEDGVFSATDFNNPPLLSINAPIGLNFRDNPGDIVNSSVVNENKGLEVNTGQNITLLGGDVTFDGGNIFAPGGKVELGGLVSEGTVSFDENGNLDFSEDATKGNVSLIQGAEVDVRSENGGFITVNANNLEILNGSAIIAGIGEGLGSPQSQAGDITINVSDQLTLESDANSLASGIFNLVDIDGLGNAGDIIINATTVEGNDNFGIGSATAGQGNAGQVVVNASKKVSLSGGGAIGSFVAPEATGDGNDIIINTSSLSLSDGVGLITSTFGQGNAGNIQVNASESISLSGSSSLQAESFGQGNGGNVSLSTTNLTLSQGSTITNSTSGEGDAGTVNINAAGTISADGENADGFASGIFSTVESPAVGSSGGIDITTTDLNLTKGAIVSADTRGEGDAGAITINAAGTISADGEDADGFVSAVVSEVAETAIGNSGGINITTIDLSLTQGGVVAASTFGQGDAGTIKINASGTIFADGDFEDFTSGIFSTVESSAVGNSGGINITTTDLTLTQYAAVAANTRGEGDAGDISINASGTIFAFADGIDAEGFGSGIVSTVKETGNGNAAGINIDSNNLSLSKNAEISVSSFGEGNASDITINTNSLSLDSGASLSATTPVETGGSINLEIADSLTLSENSTISGQAFNNADGGNININSKFVIASPNQNNDIIAAAENGSGGGIEITADGVFGLAQRESNPPNETNDIDASSEVGLDGDVSITILETNLFQDVIETPEIATAEQTTAQVCNANRGTTLGNGLTVKGKGGIPPAPELPLTSANIHVDGDRINANSAIPQPVQTSKGKIQPARGIKVTKSGAIILTAYRTNNAGDRLPTSNQNCA